MNSNSFSMNISNDEESLLQHENETQTENECYFIYGSTLYYIFNDDTTGRDFRALICLIWGVSVLLIAIFTMHFCYDHTITEAFFFGKSIITFNNNF